MSPESSRHSRHNHQSNKDKDSSSRREHSTEGRGSEQSEDGPKKEPLSLEEILAKAKVEQEALTKVTLFLFYSLFFLFVFVSLPEPITVDVLNAIRAINTIQKWVIVV